MAWYKPNSLDQALEILQAKKPVLVGGGTDLFVNWPRRQDDFAGRDWLEIDRLEELHQISRTNEGLEIGAALTAAQIWSNPLCDAVPALQKAARIVGGWQIQNRASIGGNIANASPAADMVVPLFAFDAQVRLRSLNGRRTVPIRDFILGPRTTQLKDDEMITAILIPEQVLGVPQTFLRHDQRGGTDISIISVAAVIQGTRSGLDWGRIAIGAANPKPLTVPSIDALLNGAYSEDLIDRIASLYAEQCNPITDIRASSAYRQSMVKVFIKRAAQEIID